MHLYPSYSRVGGGLAWVVAIRQEWGNDGQQSAHGSGAVRRWLYFGHHFRLRLKSVVILFPTLGFKNRTCCLKRKYALHRLGGYRGDSYEAFQQQIFECESQVAFPKPGHHFPHPTPRDSMSSPTPADPAPPPKRSRPSTPGPSTPQPSTADTPDPPVLSGLQTPPPTEAPTEAPGAPRRPQPLQRVHSVCPPRALFTGDPCDDPTRLTPVTPPMSLSSSPPASPEWDPSSGYSFDGPPSPSPPSPPSSPPGAPPPASPPPL